MDEATRVLAAARVAALVGDFPRDPAYKGLAEALRVVITDGRVPVGVRLPSERELTDALRVSRTTVARAYAELRERGFLVSRRGSGSVASLPSSRGRRGDPLLPPGELPEDKVDLTCAAPTPGPGILAAYERAVAALPEYLAGSGYYPTGVPALRQAIAERFTARGLPTEPGQVMVVNGAQAGVAVTARALLRRGTRVLVESPSYPNAVATLRQSGGRLLSSHVGREDPAVDDLVRTIGQVKPGLAYLIPDFHNPTGHLYDDRDRGRIARALRNVEGIALVDESMVDLPLDDQEMPAPFASHRVTAVTVGSVSKPFWGGLRVGWVRAPDRRIADYLAARLTLDLGVPVLEQLVALDLLRDGEALLQHRRTQLRESRDAGLAALAEHLPDWQVRRPGGGLSLWCELPAPHSSDLLAHAEARDVLLAPGPSFAPEGGLDRFLRLPFSVPAHVLTDAVPRIAAAWQRTLAEAGTSRSERQPGPTLVA